MSETLWQGFLNDEEHGERRLGLLRLAKSGNAEASAAVQAEFDEYRRERLDGEGQ